MSKVKFAEIVKDGPTIGAMEAVREGIQAIAPGLSFDKIISDIGNELKHQTKAGAHELAAALFRGDAFVMYGKEETQKEGHGLPETAKANEGLQEATKEQERGGRE